MLAVKQTHIRASLQPQNRRNLTTFADRAPIERLTELFLAQMLAGITETNPENHHSLVLLPPKALLALSGPQLNRTSTMDAPSMNEPNCWG